MIHKYLIEPVDIVAIERQARRMQARAMAEGFRNLFVWLRDRFSGTASTAGARTARTA